MSDKNKTVERLKKAILNDYPRMSRGDKFRFACHGALDCFNSCCSDVNIFLTPYDVLRMKNRLGITSQDFLDRYTILPVEKNLKYPVLVLKLTDDEEKICHFVDKEKGCTIYEDRPWACRMYPVGLASPKEGEKSASPKDECTAKCKSLPGSDGKKEEFFFLMKEEGCLGFKEDREWTVEEWMKNQGVPAYDEMGRLFKELTLHDSFSSEKQLSPEAMEMFYIACYNLDRFRDLLFNSSFLERFKIEDELREKLGNDDEELLLFAFRWLRFSLFGEKTLEVIDREPRGKKAREAKK